MKRVWALLLAATASVCATNALAGAQCQLSQDGNTWNLVCQADDSGMAGDEFQCDYMIAVTNDQNESDVVEATGSVSRDQSGTIIWSAIQDGGYNIVSASVQSGSCGQ
jgi:invasion protein IalB